MSDLKGVGVGVLGVRDRPRLGSRDESNFFGLAAQRDSRAEEHRLSSQLAPSYGVPASSLEGISIGSRSWWH